MAIPNFVRDALAFSVGCCKQTPSTSIPLHAILKCFGLVEVRVYSKPVKEAEVL
jgi:hypothetical protein